MTTFALIPAAGKSTRMGRPKLTLPLGGCTVLEQVIRVLREGGVEVIVVVAASHTPQVADLAESAGACVCRLSTETQDMLETIQHGLRFLEERFLLDAADPWFLIPGDHPTLKPAVVQKLLAAWAAQPEYSIFLPTWQGRRGHPALLAGRHAAAIRGLPTGRGLNAYVREQLAATLELPVASASVLCDLDTPEEYVQLQAAFAAS